MNYELGIQSAVYRDKDVRGLVGELRKIDVGTIELGTCHLSHREDEQKQEQVITALDDADIDVCGYGVVFFDEGEEPRDVIRVARRLGGEYLSFNVRPGNEKTLRELTDVANDTDVQLAIHNVSNDDVMFSTIPELRAAVTDGSPSALRVCLDTGHVIARNEPLKDAFESIGDYVDVVHLKEGDNGAERLSLTNDDDLRYFMDLFDEFISGEQIIIEHRTDTGELTQELGRIIGSITEIAR